MQLNTGRYLEVFALTTIVFCGTIQYFTGVAAVLWLPFFMVLVMVVGTAMDMTPTILILTPVLLPVTQSLGIDPVHFGIMMVVNMEVGMCHPPVGLNLYVASGITRMGITELTVAVWPWLLTMLGFLILITYVPQITLFLPRLLGM